MDSQPPPSNAWSAHQLTEFVASVAEQSDLRHAVDRALDELCATFSAQIAMIVHAGELLGSTCLDPANGDPEALVSPIVEGTITQIDGPDGTCHMSVARHGSDDDSDCVLIVGRADPPLASEEIGLLRSMSRVLGLSLTTFRLADSLRERQNLLERLAEIQRSITRRSDLDDVLDAVVAGAVDLLGANAVMIRLRDDDDPSLQRIVASRGLDETIIQRCSEIGINEGISGRVRLTRGIVIETIGPGQTIDPALPPEHALVIAAPIHNAGTNVGAIIVVFSDSPRQGLIEDRRGAVSLFAEHASMALTDADAVQAMKFAMRDPLTHLPNRLAFRDRLTRAQTERPDDTSSAVLFVDLDGFKEVNDAFGHTIGDELLASVAARLIRLVRPGDAGRRGRVPAGQPRADARRVDAAAAALDGPRQPRAAHLRPAVVGRARHVLARLSGTSRRVSSGRRVASPDPTSIGHSSGRQICVRVGMSVEGLFSVVLDR